MVPRAGEISLEARFFRATVPEYYRELPEYLLALERATPFEDVRGVDVFAHVLYPWLLQPVRIPIQIKGSPKGVARWQSQHRELAKANTIALVMRERDDDFAVRALLSEELDRRRSYRLRYDGVLTTVLAEPISESGKRIVQKIVVDRLLEPVYPSYRRPYKLPLVRRLRYFYS